MIEELQALAAPRSLVRIPPEIDVPLTPRVRRLLDTAPMRRLGRVSQLGLVSLVYPGAVHSRLEHSLGVYRGALLFLQRLQADARFQQLVSADQAATFVLAALLHDVGHWPFCHPIEDMQLPGVPGHERRAAGLVEQGEIAERIDRDWPCRGEDVMHLLQGPQASDGARLLGNLLSGPIDVDKMDYLVRDSLHAGVPYGRNFDTRRLTGALCVHPREPRLAIGDKGRTAAEMMVFARYVMFSEVYWHHAVRSATAMLQRALFLIRERADLAAAYDLDQEAWIGWLRQAVRGSDAAPLAEGLFGMHRGLWKRVAEFNQWEHPDLHRRLARRPYSWLVACSERLAERLTVLLDMRLTAADIIIDAPPARLEVDIDIDVVMRGGIVRSLGDVSPVVEALARRQFDDFVKRVRVFVRPDVRRALPGGQLDREILEQAVQATEVAIVS